MNLAETQVALRKMILAFFGIAFAYYAGVFVIGKTKHLILKIKPPEPIPAEARFGLLPRLTMSGIKIEGKPVYVLDTKDGRLPTFPDRVKVYPIIRPKPNLLSEQRIKKLAMDLGFNEGFNKISSSEFKWIDGRNNRVLEANVITKAFSLKTPIEKLGAVTSKTPTITESDGKSKAENFIKSKGLIPPPDLDNLLVTTEPSQIVFGKMKSSRGVPNQSKIIKVDVYRKIIQSRIVTEKTQTKTSYKVIGPNPRNSLITIYVTNDSGVFKFPIVEFQYWQPNYDEGSDYFISPISEVWQTIKNGNGVITYLKSDKKDYYEETTNTNLERVEIRNIYLAYYERPTLTQYLQPIYVFDGIYTAKTPDGTTETGEIVLYYPAVRGDFVK